ncbi:hypothetical protein GXW71_08870 [Roseomonas hellenica]|uniref:ABC-type transport auxiliary lipoprotein component domain-containing protein n=1 Tax=Plastoroseomonas hellenica TaxID=2687306 RepID=A0ABS5EVY9_9PROT|nr:hypothetical protein [Plastoroseomonas hellenica]MBR0664465.1 hypothetical protein [Plastoroseomonas hellenica]
MKARIVLPVLVMSLVAACATLPSENATLPEAAVQGLGDSGRYAILNTSYAFATPANLAQRPVDSALAIAQAEYLAVDLTSNQRWREFSPIIAQGFLQARSEWRAAAGIAQDAPPQPVIGALFVARDGMLRGDTGGAAGALSAPIFVGGGEATLRRLSSLPYLPRTAAAARGAENELTRMQMAPDE